MVDPEKYIKDGLKIVDTLISQGNLQAALSGCQELLKVNPYHRKLQKYLEKIEGLLLKRNEEKVDADIDATMHLWKEERYEDLANIYTRLYQYAPNYKRLKELLQKLNAQRSKQQKNEREEYLGKALAAILGLVQENRFGDTIQACNELLGFDPLNREATELLQKAKDKLIQQKLAENERIVNGADAERALELFTTLLAIDPNHSTVKKLALQAKVQLAERSVLAAKIQLNESIARMKELFKNAEYEKVIQSCEEIARTDPGNLTAKIFRKKAEETMHAEIDAMAVKFMKEAFLALVEQYQKKPEVFVKI